MKAIIYYSLSGRTKEELKKRFEGDYYEIKGSVKIPKSHGAQLFYLGFYSSYSVPLNYKDLNIDFSKYDEIVLGSPVWAFTFVPFLKRYLREHKFKNKKVHILVTCGNNPGNVLKHFKRYLDKSNEIVSEEIVRFENVTY